MLRFPLRQYTKTVESFSGITSAAAVSYTHLSYAAQENGQWYFALDRAATEKCKRFSALHEQDGNALFFQIMCVLKGDDFSEPTDDQLIDGLSDVIFYMDFSGIFDRSSTLPRCV